MKRLSIIVAIMLLGISTMNAQWFGSKTIKGNGKMTSEKRSTGNYEGVALVGSMNVELIAGKEGALTIEGESNLLEYITTVVENGKLKISVEKGVSIQSSNNKTIKITVPFEDINEVTLTGSGDIWNKDRIKSEYLTVNVTGSGDIKLNIYAKGVKSGVTGSGDIMLSGSTKSLNCAVTGSGDFQAFQLNAEDVEAAVSGSGDIEISASKSLEAKVSGSGDITYKGNPEKHNFKTFGSGDISKY